VAESESVLVWPTEIRAHDGAQLAGGRVPAWRPRDGALHCSYCGSIRPQDLWETFRDVEPTPRPYLGEYPGNPDTTSARDFRDWYTAQVAAVSHWVGMSFADWKYGYPHKIYPQVPGRPGMIKFYVSHLADLNDTALAAVSEVIHRHTGIAFSRDDRGRLMYHSHAAGCTCPDPTGTPDIPGGTS
jgi:hypothetical protein